MIEKFSMSFLIGLLLPVTGYAQGKMIRPEIQKRNDSLTEVLSRIGYDDQKYRNKMDSFVAVYGGDSPQMKVLFKKMAQTDSINFIVVSSILETYGWLGPSAIGPSGNKTLFMVVQHAPLKGQEKYLPVMRKAVKDGNAKGGNLALLEDRIALKNGKKQVYGSQISWNMKTNEYYVLPLDDPDNVDKRRMEVGLGPLAEYVRDCCNLVWNVAEYKKSAHANEVIAPQR